MNIENTKIIDTNHGLIGNLFLEFKKHSLVLNHEDFFKYLISADYIPYSNTNVWAFISKHDYFNRSCYDDTYKALCNIDEYLENTRRLCKKLDITQRASLNEKLYQILKDITEYCSKRTTNGKAVFSLYNENIKKKLLGYYYIKKEHYSLEYNIYLFIFFAVCKTLPDNFFYGINYRNDLKEFNDKIVCKYGVTSEPGIRAIIELAETNNIFALYEYADMLYYGKINGQIRNLELAIQIYNKAAGINVVTGAIESACHPLALWTLAYIYFNYHRKKNELENCETIPYIEMLSIEQRIEKSIIYAQASMDIIDSVAAANVLGRIAQVAPYYLKEKYNLQTADYYFNHSAAGGYIYAFNNLANIELHKIFFDEDNKAKHLKSFIDYLYASAKRYEPWAATTLGRFYLNGIVTLKGENSQDDLTTNFPSFINKDKAKECFKLATNYFNDSNSAWAYENLITNFPEDYTSNIDLLKKHVLRIKELRNKKAFNALKDEIPNVYKNFPEILDVINSVSVT